MTTPNSPDLTRPAAEALLRQFTCSEQPPAIEPAVVRQALHLVADQSDYQIFGLCADTAVAAQTALHDYLAALGYEDRPELQIDRPAGAVYLKYNPKTGRSHLDGYVGPHRGVLVSCQSAYDGDVNETFGHLPLNLFR